MLRRSAVVAALVLVAACSPAASQTTGSSSMIPASYAAPTASPIAAATASLPSAIVGTWRREQSCDELMAAFRASGLLEAHRDWAAELCAETQVPAVHSHFFTADGRFGSHDDVGQQVDDGDYEELAPGELRFPSHADAFGYEGGIVVAFQIDGNVATFDVDVPVDCSGPCGVAYFWALSAFASGPWMSTR